MKHHRMEAVFELRLDDLIRFEFGKLKPSRKAAFYSPKCRRLQDAFRMRTGRGVNQSLEGAFEDIFACHQLRPHAA